MEWIEVFVETSEEGLEPVAGFLYQCGLTGLMIEDGRDFQDFLENPEREWDYIEDALVEEKTAQKTGITFFVRNNLYGTEQLATIQSGLLALGQTEKELPLGSLQVDIKHIQEEDWANNWKKYFKPFPVGERLYIKPSWETLLEDQGRTVLHIDPGHIFGTGTHETTQLCLELIEQYLEPGNRVLDIGCGSGILSIGALLLGAEAADAVDIDPNAIEIATENAKRNEISMERYHIKAGNILADASLDKAYTGKGYHMVVANIVADVVIALTEQVPAYLKNQGIFVASGIIQERLDDVLGALEGKGFTVIATNRRKDWVAVVSRYEGK